MPQPPEPGQIEYAPPLSRGAAVWRRWSVPGNFLFAIVAAILLVPPAYRHARLLQWQNACMSFNSPARAVVYDRQTSRIPQPWQNFYALLSPPGFNSHGTVFLHSRTSPSGDKRLVAVDVVRLSDGEILVSRVF